MNVKPIIIDLAGNGTSLTKEGVSILEKLYGKEDVDGVSSVIGEFKGERKRIELTNYLNTLRKGVLFMVTYHILEKKISLDYGASVQLTHHQLFIIELKY